MVLFYLITSVTYHFATNSRLGYAVPSSNKNKHLVLDRVYTAPLPNTNWDRHQPSPATLNWIKLVKKMDG